MENGCLVYYLDNSFTKRKIRKKNDIGNYFGWYSFRFYCMIRERRHWCVISHTQRPLVATPCWLLNTHRYGRPLSRFKWSKSLIWRKVVPAISIMFSFWVIPDNQFGGTIWWLRQWSRTSIFLPTQLQPKSCREGVRMYQLHDI